MTKKTKKAMLYYGGGASFGGGVGLQNLTLITDKWVGMIDSGFEFLAWPPPDTDLSKVYFHSPRERKFVETIIRNEEVEDGIRPQDIFRNWTRGPDFSLLKEFGIKADFVLYTHGHQDHIGGAHFALPHMQPWAKFWGAPHTLDMMAIALLDSKKLSPYLFSKYGREIKECLARRKMVKLDLNEITPQGIWVGLSGHTPGAINYGIRLPNGKVAGATGDIAWHWQPMVCESRLPDDLPDEWLYDCLIITDFTYSFIRETSYDDDLVELLTSVRQSLKEKNVVVISTYAFAKGVGIASLLSNMGIPVYIDGMIRKVWDICLRWRHFAPRYPALHTANVRKIGGRRHREEVIAKLEQEGGVVITTSASGEGPARRYQRAGLHQEKYHFIYVGWVPDDSIMRQIHFAIETDSLRPNIHWSDQPGETRIVNIRAKIERRSASSHGDLKDWQRFLEKLVARRKGRKLDAIFVGHCLDAAKKNVVEAMEPYAERIEAVTKEKRIFELY